MGMTPTPLTLIIGLTLIIIGIVLLFVSYGIFKITRSKNIGALFVVLLLIASALIVLGFWLTAAPYLLGGNSTVTPTSTHTT
jgi:hypothetical protein